MKLIILSIVLMQVFSLQEIDQGNVDAERKAETKQYWFGDPIPYSSYYYWDYWYDYTYWWPGVYYSWDWYSYWRKAPDARKSETTEKTFKKTFNEDEAKKQLSELKKEIWGKEEFSTEEIRKSKKAYDAKWLLAQLKIARTLELEDMIKNPPKEKSVDRKVEKKENKKLREEEVQQE
jgi:hypothetical protein